MNALVQLESGVIASEDALNALEKKDNAKLLVLGDSHGDFETVSDIVLRFGKEVDALVFCGDGFCDLIGLFELSFIDDKIKKALPSVIIPVKGNGDSTMYTLRLPSAEEEESYMQYTLLGKTTCEIAGRGIFVAHGDHYRVDMGTDTLLAAAHAIDSDLVFFGHTHVTHWEEAGGTLVLNPGSCSHSRSKLPPSFAIVSFPGEQDRYNIEFFGIEKSMFKNHKFVPLAVHTT